MRAAYLARPGVVEIGDFPEPEPRDGQVLVRMRHASICGSDVHIVFDDMHDPARLGQPGYPGHEGVGTVVDSRSDRVPQGAMVLTVPPGSNGGCFAEYQLLDDGQVVVLPPGHDPQRLLLAQQLGTTIYALRKFVADPSEPVGSAAVIGAGSAGLFFLQQLKRAGCPLVVVSDRDPDRLRTARQLGADETVHVPHGSVVEAAREHTGGAGVDLVVEAAGYDVCRAEAVEAARERGTLGLYGYPERTGPSPFPVERAFRRSLSMEWINGTQREPGLRSFREALDAIANGRIAVDHCLQRNLPLESAATALQIAREHGHGAAKVGLDLA